VSFDILVQINILCTFAMLGLIWTIQVVHYPIFFHLKNESFKDFEKIHINRISFVVIPFMIFESFATVGLVFTQKAGMYEYFNLFLIFLIWLATFTLSIPCHNKLMRTKDDMIIKKLVRTNWIRTILWSIKSFVIYTQYL
jgi:hypothetical protein